MSQHDMDLINADGAAFRADLNLALKALASTSSGDGDPGTMYANQLYYETDTNVLKIRNEANDAWIDILTLDQAGDKLDHITLTPTGNSVGFTVVNVGTGDGIVIDQDGNGVGLRIDSEATNQSSIMVLAIATATQVVDIINAGVAGGGTSCVRGNLSNGSSSGNCFIALNAGTGNGMFLDQDGNGIALRIDSESTTDIANFDGATGDCNIKTDGDLENTNNAYGVISDRKLKRDEILSGSQWDDVKAIAGIVKKYRLRALVEKDADAPFHIGPVAQDLELISPGLVYENDDYEEYQVQAEDKDGDPLFEMTTTSLLDENERPIVRQGDPIMLTERRKLGTTTKGVKASIIYMKAVKALGEAMERIEALEARAVP